MTTDPRFKFYGNVAVGQPASSGDYPLALHVPLTSISPYYNAILFTYGASSSNPLGIPGSHPAPLGNVYPALAFVGWYNGHPGFAGLNPDLSGIETVDVVGQGNVALDVARILLSPVDRLAKSDLPERVLDVLAKSAVRRVRAVGRRGPAQVAFTTKELREMTKLGVRYPGVEASLMALAKEEAKGDRMRTRMLGLMEKPVDGGEDGREFELAFLRSPRRFIPDDNGKVHAVEWEINQLEGAKAVGTGRTETRDVDMVVESVGYRSDPMEGAPFDASRGRLYHDGGRVGEVEHLGGAYAAGWVARGPVGVIASTMQDAYTLVDRVLEDWEAGFKHRGVIPAVAEEGVPPVIAEGLKDGKVVDMDRWLRIDQAERDTGVKKGRDEREKFSTVDEMLAVQ